MRIKSITFKSGNFEAQRKFYGERLGIPIAASGKNFFELQLQQTTVRFEEANPAHPYHFAFNIPSNKATEALAWLKERVEILPFQDEELIDFSNWDAWAMYFYDADNNIVEFISRQKIDQYYTQPFSPKQLISISEIGLAVTNIEKTYSDLRHQIDIDIFDGNFDRFCAVGNDNGLFILVDKNKKDWFPKDDPAYTVDFRMETEVKGKNFYLEFNNGSILFDFS